MAAIADLLDGVRAGRGGALFVVGEAGLGKTTCLEQATEQAAPTVRVALGRGDVMETSLPFGIVATALDAVGYRDLLTVPEARAGLGDVRAARFFGVLHWLQDTSDPVLLCLDDLHWADPDTLALLSFVCRRLAGLPVAVLGTLRPWPVAAQELASALSYDGHASVQQLAPLSDEAVTAMLADRLGGSVPERVARTATTLCAGNPLLIEQVAEAVGKRADALAGADATIGAEGIVLTRFAGLPAAALTTARAASVLGTRFRPAVATGIAGLDERQAEAALSALCRSGLVRAETASMAAFVHPLFGQSLYHDVVAPLRARLHARAFALLCTHGLETEAVEHAIRADLVDDPTAIGVIERAGRAAMAAGAPGTAAEHLGAAVRLAGNRACPALLLAWGEALLVGGRPGEAVAVYERLLTQADLDPADRVQTLRMLARALSDTAARDQATSRFREAAALAEACSPDALAEVLLGEVVVSWFRLGPVYALPLAARARDLAITSAPLRRQANATWGLAALLAGDGAGLAACDAAARELMSGPREPSEPGWTFGDFGPLGCLATAGLFTERFDDAHQALAGMRAASQQAGAADGLSLLLAIRQGRLADALMAMPEVSAAAELVPYWQGPALYVKAEILLLAGRLAECADWCQRGEAFVVDRGQSHVLVRFWHVRAQLFHHAGEHQGACALYERIEQFLTRIGLAEPCVVPWARHGLMSYLASGRFDDARRVIDWLERSAARLPCRWPRIAALTGRAGLADAGGDTEAADRHYQDALEQHQHVELPVEHIETLLGYGTFLRRRGQPTRARPHLAHAVEIAEKCEAHWLADQARAELAIAGGRRRRAREDPARLTAQEQRVARLAAAGHSNKAIAGQLYLSTKTVEYHLAQVYTKLGITSRRQLMTGHYDI